MENMDMCSNKTQKRQSFWERHELLFYKYGHIYASIFGLTIIDYIPQRSTHPWVKYALNIYSHVFNVWLIVVAPLYFGFNIAKLIESQDRQMQLLLYVSFCNTFIKYVTVVITYVANIAHFKAINQCTRKRQRLEAAFSVSYTYTRRIKSQFEFMMYFKFCLLNMMIMLQVGGIWVQRSSSGSMRMYFAWYSFMLWCYTENMANYFYFLTSSTLKYYQQLHIMLQHELKHYNLLAAKRHHMRGALMQRCCQLCDRLEALSARYCQIHTLNHESFHMHQFQLLGIVLTTLITNLTNSFTLFNLFAGHSLDDLALPLLLNTFNALGFYADTYIVTLQNENARVELAAINVTLRHFSQLPTLDERLDQQIEHFTLQLLNRRKDFAICGLFYLDRNLVFVIAATVFSYFVTLVQFDINLR